MNKKVWSVLLLCLAIVAFIATAVLAIDTNSTILKLNNAEISVESFLGELMVLIATWLAFVFFAFLLSAVGFFAAMGGMKLAQSTMIKRISTAIMYIHAVIAVIALVCIVELLFQI